MRKWNQRLISAAVGMLLLLSLVYVGREVVLYTTGKGVGRGEEGGRSAENYGFCVVIDAGHGSGNLRKVTKGK